MCNKKSRSSLGDTNLALLFICELVYFNKHKMELDARKPVFRVCQQQRRNQLEHPHSLSSAFVIRFWESAISKLATSKISVYELVSVAEQTGFLRNSEDRFCRVAAKMINVCIDIGLLFIHLTLKLKFCGNFLN